MSDLENKLEKEDFSKDARINVFEQMRVDYAYLL